MVGARVVRRRSVETEKNAVWLSQSIKTVASTCCKSPGKSGLCLLTNPSCFRNDKRNKNIFTQVDDGLLFGPRIEVSRFVEFSSNHVRMERLGDQKFFLGRVIVGTAREYSFAASPKYILDVIAVLGLEDSRPVTTPNVKRTPTTESLVELENEKRAVRKTAVGKLCQEGADVMYRVKEIARKTLVPLKATR